MIHKTSEESYSLVSHKKHTIVTIDTYFRLPSPGIARIAYLRANYFAFEMLM